MDETCLYCDRVCFGTIQMLAFGHWRHEACAPGSKAWINYYNGLKSCQRTFEADLLLIHGEKQDDTQGS